LQFIQEIGQGRRGHGGFLSIVRIAINWIISRRTGVRGKTRVRVRGGPEKCMAHPRCNALWAGSFDRCEVFCWTRSRFVLYLTSGKYGLLGPFFWPWIARSRHTQVGAWAPGDFRFCGRSCRLLCGRFYYLQLKGTSWPNRSSSHTPRKTAISLTSWNMTWRLRASKPGSINPSAGVICGERQLRRIWKPLKK